MPRGSEAALGGGPPPPAEDFARMPETTTSGSATLRIEARDMGRRYSGLVIRGVTVKPSPEIVRRRLEAVGSRPISNVVDVTNYVMLAAGHPLHAYDLDKLADATIVVRRGKAGEKMRSLDGEMRTIDPESVVIADGKHAVGLGGSMWGAENEIGPPTRDLRPELP